MGNLKMLVLLFLLTISGCCFECKDKNTPTYLMDGDFKDYLYFPVGSYWVYTDNAGNNDSIYLYLQNHEINSRQTAYRFNFEQFSQNFSSSYFKDTLLGGAMAMKSYDTVLFTYTEGFISNSPSLQFFDKKNPGYVMDFADNSAVKYVGLFPSYYANGIKYEDVKAFENLIATDPNLPRKIYYARNIGAIRKELFNGQVWEIKRYHINR
jgi:hypothetical protein